MRTTNPSTGSPRMFNQLRFTNEGVIWLVIAAVIAVLGWYKSVNLMLLLGYTMICLMACNALFARDNVRRIQTSHENSAPLLAGEEEVTRLTVSNLSSFSATVLVDEKIGETADRWLIANLEAKTSVPCYARRVFANRGRFLVRVEISSGSPIGLIAMVKSIDMGEVLVLPSCGLIDADGLMRWYLRQSAGTDSGKKILRRMTSDQADVRGIRPYRAGDSIRTIHWRSSARRGELMVREYDKAPVPELILVVEPWLPPNPSAFDQQKLESALSLAATLALNWARIYGSEVTVAVAGEPESITRAEPTERGIRQTLSPLAALLGSESFEAIPRESFGRSLARSARLVVSSRSGSPYAIVLARSTGKPFMSLSPGDQIPWYQPPQPFVKIRS